LPSPKVTVAVPTLAAGDALADCLRSLEAQCFTDFEVVVIDNSGVNSAAGPVRDVASPRVRVIANPRNAGFGTAVNQAFRSSEAPLLAALNDDAVAHPGWLAALVKEADTNPYVGMFASQVRMSADGTLDSAAMLIAADGSSRQRGHGERPENFDPPAEALFPSGSAALYRREMLDQAGYFDETFFLYCEDVDLGLRAQWAGWECRYVAQAIAEHRYSHTAGAASPMKAYYTERNRLYTIVKNFPANLLLRAPFAAVARYFWHLISLVERRGKAAEFQMSGETVALLPFLVLRAHASTLLRLPRLLRERRRIFRSRKLSSHEFEQLLAKHSLSVRQVAAL
jgi:GT2 family glycosyltransferase